MPPPNEEIIRSEFCLAKAELSKKASNAAQSANVPDVDLKDFGYGSLHLRCRHGDLLGATRLIVAAECAAHEKSQKCRRCQSLCRITLQHMLNVIGHTLQVGVANVISGGVDFAGG